ncbi:hypothetical protein LCGC14_0123580 [marine sediment metagenome]|uniref:Protein kinase domain-containing protein n=1 Tax=marine sediment metagenome TaxID=412755 RepID=A0A0F9VAB4_9ZZZZ|nr:protein kinase [Maribacter sp.]|tara:strand:+ start:3741 stop:4583 length:843 start_codon:yes stop_codon:yes gene_type:complete
MQKKLFENIIQNYEILKIVSDKTSKLLKVKCKLNLEVYAIKLVPINHDFKIPHYDVEVSHTNVINCFKVFDSILYQKKYYKAYILEWSEFGDIRSLASSKFKLTNFFFSDIILGLKHLQNLGLFHGDLKPSNILAFKSDTRIVFKLADYGVKYKGIGSYITPEYAPPEYLNREVNSKYDIWCFGCILFELFTGDLPFGSRTNDNQISEILENIQNKPLPKEWMKIKEPYRYIIVRCLTKDAQNRISNYNDILDLLKRKPNLFNRIEYLFYYIKGFKNQDI